MITTELTITTNESTITTDESTITTESAITTLLDLYLQVCEVLGFGRYAILKL